ncbi:MAG: lytic murein transglycosylase [Alphaproteobacteria bacterium]|nr:lytic murein transglycosylase [Alphaproteobacteria bacterium]
MIFRQCRAMIVMIATTLALTLPTVAAGAQQPFAEWLRDLRSEAAGKGIRAPILDKTLGSVELLPRVIELDRHQPEFKLTYSSYMRHVVSKARITNGRVKMAKHQTVLATIAAKYGVPARFIVALWGMESDYGHVTGGFPIIPALVTLAYDGRRSAYFRKELFNALTILDHGDITPERMTGSWAGAMGQCQFMPSSFLKFAEDFEGTGRRDIWRSEADVFASTANFLAKSGWDAGQSWGRAVRLPKGFNTALADLSIRKSLDEWSALGIRASKSHPLPKSTARAALVLPEGRGGRAFLVSDNFDVLRKWNQSNLFALAAGHLADSLGRK